MKSNKAISNPWKTFNPTSKSCIHPSDHDVFQGWQKRIERTKSATYFQLQDQSLPEPFIGNVKDPKVIFLAANPGHQKKDLLWQSEPYFRNLMLKNLVHDNTRLWPEAIECGFAATFVTRSNIGFVS